ncbi:MAG: DNA glycosylase [Veillonellaceae bacterium]|nr:DNA glycosylase [Veillonellaceae bacterium]
MDKKQIAGTNKQAAINSETTEVELRPFPPFLTARATVLMMGSFPPAADKRAMSFHYPNFTNDMWRVYGLVFFDDADYFRLGQEKAFDADKIKAFLRERGIASCPSVKRAVREHNNASDKFLKVIETVDLKELLDKLPLCRYICTTGGKASDIVLSLTDNPPKTPKTNETIQIAVGGRPISFTRLPSTSRAYPLKLVKKAEAYKDFFRLAHLI